MALQIVEQETHINFMRGDSRAVIYTSDTNMMTKFNKLVEAGGTEWKRERVEKLPRTGEIIGVTYSCPVNLVSYRKKTMVQKLNPEKKLENLAKARAVRRSKTENIVSASDNYQKIET